MMLHPPLDLQGLSVRSALGHAAEADPSSVLAVETSRGVAHVTRIEDVLYLPKPGLQIMDGASVPQEGIVDPWNLGYLQRKVASEPGRWAAFRDAFEVARDEDTVCVLSNMFSSNFSHFTEEMLKVLVFERSALRPTYIYADLPGFALQYWDALGLDRRRLRQVSTPTMFAGAVYSTGLSFNDLSPCPDVFFELRDRMYAAANEVASDFGERLWLDRGAKVADDDRDLVNGDEIQPLLDDHGFTRVDMGALPLVQQVAVARRARVLAGPHGSAFVHSMYMQPGGTVIEAFSPHYVNGYSFEICRVLQHRYTMIVDNNAAHWPYAFGRRVNVHYAQLRLAFEGLR